jgi:hypothetical protein
MYIGHLKNPPDISEKVALSAVQRRQGLLALRMNDLMVAVRQLSGSPRAKLEFFTGILRL